MDSLGPLTFLLSQAKKGKLTAKEIVAPLEASIKLIGNASAHFSVEQRKSIMKFLNKDLKPLGEETFPDGGPLLFGEEFASRAKSMVDNGKALKGFMQKRSQKSFSWSGDRNKGKSVF